MIEDEREIAVRPHAMMTLVETSKAVYHPRESAQIRLVTFDRALKPVDHLLQRVWVENSRGLTVMEWKNLRTTGGLTSLSVPISHDNLYGTWKVKAMANNMLVAEKSFRVEEHDDPQVYIQLKEQEYIPISGSEATRTICVQDQAGSPAQGRITVRAGYQGLNPSYPMDIFSSQVNILNY